MNDQKKPRWKLILTMDDGSATEWQESDPINSNHNRLVLYADGPVDRTGLTLGKTGEFRASVDEPTVHRWAIALRVVVEGIEQRRMGSFGFCNVKSILTLCILEPIALPVPGQTVTLADAKGYGLNTGLF